MSWLHRLFTSKQMEINLDKELRFHFDAQVADKMRSGVPEAEARRLTRIEFGGLEQIKEDCRERRGTLGLESIAQDVRYAIRRLRKSPGFSIIVVLTLALGVGANTVIFSLLQSILLRSLPVADPGRLYRIGDQMSCCYLNGFESDNGDYDLFSYDLFRQFQKLSPEFEQLAAVQAGGGRYSVRWGTASARVMLSEYVSGNYFTTFGVNAFAGRVFSADDDRTGAAPVVVLSYSAWQREFGGNPNVIGSTLRLDQQAFTVAGIAPPGFYGDRIAPFPPEMWLPLGSEPTLEGSNSVVLHQPDNAWLYAIGRVRPGVNLGSLQAKLSEVLRQWMKTRSALTAHGGAAEIPRQHVVLSQAGGGIQKIQQQTGTALRMLMLLSSVVLLIACANIANLMLARSTAQRAEIAVRIGLGATRGRIIQQILIESLILSSIGGVVGLAVAFLGSRAILGLAFPLAPNNPMQAGPTWMVAAFALCISIITGLLFAAAPAAVSLSTQPAGATRAKNSTSRDHATVPQRLLLIFQVALSMVLLATAFLATRSLYKLEHQRIGVETANRYTVQMDLNGPGYAVDSLNGIYHEIEDRFSALPGITRVSFARYLPLEGNEWGSCVILQGHAAPGPRDKCNSDWDRVSANFLDSVGVPVIRGRGFSQNDENGGAGVVIVNQAFVKRFFPNQDPIGQRFGVDRPEYSGAFQIVGVFADFKLTDAHREIKPLFLRPLGQQFLGYKSTAEDGGEVNSLYLNRMVLEFNGPRPDELESLVRSTLAQIDPNLPLVRVRAYSELIGGNFNQDRLLARLTEAFGMLALILASVGLYGVMSYQAVRRASEIGIRMALGASRPMIAFLFVRNALLQFFAGVAIGIPVALLVSRSAGHLLYEISSNDPLTFVGATALLGLCATVAALIPAIQAASADPLIALRSE
jgi:macrolide transport system ATP-binding/permease protein